MIRDTLSGHHPQCPEHAAHMAREFPALREGGTGVLWHELRDGKCVLCGVTPLATAPAICPKKVEWFEEQLRIIHALALIPFDTIGNNQVENLLINLAATAHKLAPAMFAEGV